MAEKRLFTGIPLPEKVLQLLKDFRDRQPPAKGLRWTRPENLHLTTCFIGNTSKVQELASQLRAYCAGKLPFSLNFKAFSLMPPSRSRMLWARFEETEEYFRFVRPLHQLLLPGQPPQHEQLAHVTLARFHSFSRHTHLDLTTTEQFVLPVQEVWLWESIASPQGVRYVPLEKCVIG